MSILQSDFTRVLRRDIFQEPIDRPKFNIEASSYIWVIIFSDVAMSIISQSVQGSLSVDGNDAEPALPYLYRF
jgi:hypothetical protein